MPLQAQTPLFEIPLIAKKFSSRLKKLDIHTIEDVVYHFPFRYEDYSRVVKVSELKAGDFATVVGKVEMIESRRSAKKRMIITEAIISDDTGQVKLVWFHQPYVSHYIDRGDDIIVSGEVSIDAFAKQFVSPLYEVNVSVENAKTVGKILPIYHTTANITQKQMRFLVQYGMEQTQQENEWLPDEIVRKYGFLSLFDALKKIHVPHAMVEAERARKRFAFSELFEMQCLMQKMRIERRSSSSFAMNFFHKETQECLTKLPFTLTDDQKNAIKEISVDMSKNVPMNRLLQGDVGSGKTVVAFAAMLNACLAGFQAAFMVPTEVLARQHFENAKNFFCDTRLRLALMTGSNHEICAFDRLDGQKRDERDQKEHVEKQTSCSKETVRKAIRSGDVDVVIGTHALITDQVCFTKLGLAVIDEQHRFGVKQRKAIKEKSEEPHLLSMTATPIPRSLALTMYGDLDITSLREMPKYRKPVFTRVVAEFGRDAAYRFIRQEVKKGRQVFVICPLIEHSDALGVKAATKEYEFLQKKIFPELKVDFLHGKMKNGEKNSKLEVFKKKEADILVSTSVIEVGIDVPNATIMMIEGAERFGLAQLHQFRGRVGRGDHQSYCFLFPSKDVSNVYRLKLLADCHDGFELAERDLRFRGAGEILGMRQSGSIELRVADISDTDLILTCRKEAEEIFRIDKDLNAFPALQKRIAAKARNLHLE
ncbi:MAG: ATP-dependent DNA helicase RecG [Parcubacteria group bacterium]|nr:ATP-dependent DNA helicase RecG [Parcubacteria group bacterium]